MVDLDLKRSTAAIAKETAEIAAKQAALKDIELKNAAAYRAADTLLKRQEALRNDISALLTLLDMHQQSAAPVPDEVKKDVLSRCNSISLFVSPRGKFDEKLNDQLGHIAAFLDQGREYWEARPGFISAFRLNCWNLVDAEFGRVRDTIQRGTLVERQQPEPYLPPWQR
ncbi:hypothetical protein QO004_002986 [Rhizobium mesoamericanum]|uniref:hypothetical protein n=1 Tax=Rhizobium mesoamericanum TaxID=1079800 RepID=UPI0027808C02|nr:hypothetical protein [Rhizobium mesoamericanum]MDQ0561193.1 hypothetical protein [Rhizobium mesoamericanum]